MKKKKDIIRSKVKQNKREINMSDDSSCDKLNKTIKKFNDYLAKINKEIDLNQHDLKIHYDYDIVPLPNDIINEANRKDK